MSEAMMHTIRQSIALEGSVNQIAKLNLAVPAVATPMELLASAIERGMGLETIEKLMALQERFEASQARKAFDNAMAAAKAEIPVIMKNRTVDFTSPKGRTHYRHEDLAEVARTVNPILAKHGLSYRFRTKSAIGEPISVTCVVCHRDGFFEENELIAPRDDTGNKNSIQQIGSTLTYLQRMTLKAALGLAASEDDDGKESESSAATISEKQVETLTKLLTDKGRTTEQLCKVFNLEQLSDLPANRYNAAVEKIASAQATKKDAGQ